MNRAVEIAGFLAHGGWDKAAMTPFEADFSPRRYARLICDDGRRAVLMDADPDQKTMEFVRLAQRLRRCGLSAPEIYATSPAQGLVLMEDFGDRNFGRLLDEGADSMPLYRRAVEVLAHLHAQFDGMSSDDPDLPRFDAALFAAQAGLYLDVYAPYVERREVSADERAAFDAAWRATLREVEALPSSLLLRDFMPDNLMDLPGRAGVAGVGLLDFQDAGLGPVAYDLASLGETVRRDGGDALFDAMVDYYHATARPALGLEDLRRACVVLAAQRHMRVLAILARAALNGKPQKLAFLPRVAARLESLARHESLAAIRPWAMRR